MTKQFKKILCPVNVRHAASRNDAYHVALDYAREHEAELHVVTVAPEIERNLNITEPKKYWTEQIQKFLDDYPPGDLRTQTEVLTGSPHRQIVKYANAKKVDLIVLEAANPKVQDYLLGTTASHVVSHCDCSVMVVRH